MKRIFLYISISMICAVLFAQQAVRIEINPNKVTGIIDKKVYGLLLEHLYHSVSNGVWGETVWNRSFEELYATGGNCSVNNEGLISVEPFKAGTALFVLGTASDYELSLDFRKTSGDGNLLFNFRDQCRGDMLTNGLFLRLGDKNNTVHELKAMTGWVWNTPFTKTAIIGRKAGKLDVGKWQKLQVICKGKRISCLLNGELLFDNEIENCPTSGAIRIGAENCKAEFKNINAKSLDKQGVKLSLNPIRHWALIGTGTIETSYKNVLNHDVAVHIQITGELAGVEQATNYRVRTNDLLKGSLFLKGNVSKVNIQLLNGNIVLVEKPLSGLSDQWKEFPLNLAASENCDSATLRITTKDKGDLYIDQVSLMSQSSIDNGGYRPDLYKAVSELKPTIIRWPGGSFVELYDFENGLGAQKDRKGILRWDDFDPLSFGTDEFIAYCHRLGAEPQIVVPIGYHNYKGYTPGKINWLQKAQDWLEYCNGDITTKYGALRAGNGHVEPYKVKYWEIDNEVWKMDPKLYAETVRLFSQRLKRQDASIKIIGCGSGRLGKEGVGLDSIMISDVAEYIDFISPHHYMDIKKFGNDGIKEYGDYLRKLDKWIVRSKNPNMKIYLSEWNLDGVDMRTGLFAGGILNELEKNQRVEMAAPALALRHTSATGWNNAFVNFDQNGYFLAPNYIVMKLWREHFAPNRIEALGETENLNVIATKSDAGKMVYVKVVNPTPTVIPIRIQLVGNLNVQNARLKLVASDSLFAKNTMEEPNHVCVREIEISRNGNVIFFTAPAFSAGVLSVEVCSTN
jgi:alpha-L-arabinofuranosidase